MTVTPLINSGLTDPAGGAAPETPEARFTRLKSAVIRGRIYQDPDGEDMANPFPAGSAEARCFDYGRGKKVPARKGRRGWPQEDLDLLAHCEALPRVTGRQRAIPAAELAAYLGRTVQAIEVKLAKLRKVSRETSANVSRPHASRGGKP